MLASSHGFGSGLHIAGSGWLCGKEVVMVTVVTRLIIVDMKIETEEQKMI